LPSPDNGLPVDPLFAGMYNSNVLFHERVAAYRKQMEKVEKLKKTTYAIDETANGPQILPSNAKVPSGLIGVKDFQNKKGKSYKTAGLQREQLTIGSAFNMDFGADYSRRAFQDFYDGNIGWGIVNLLAGTSEAVCDMLGVFLLAQGGAAAAGIAGSMGSAAVPMGRNIYQNAGNYNVSAQLNSGLIREGLKIGTVNKTWNSLGQRSPELQRFVTNNMVNLNYIGMGAIDGVASDSPYLNKNYLTFAAYEIPFWVMQLRKEIIKEMTYFQKSFKDREKK